MGTTVPNLTDYDTYYRAFRWRIPPRFNFGRDVVDRWAHDPSRRALVWSDDRGRTLSFSFRDVMRSSNQLGNALRGLGVRRGDRVLVLLPRVPEWFVALVACLKIGAVPVPCSDMLRAKDLAYRIEDSGAAAVITHADGVPHVEEAAGPWSGARVLVGDPVSGQAEVPPRWHLYADLVREGSDRLVPEDTAATDAAIMYYTSGTTGNPKGVLHAQRGLYAWREQAYCWLDLTPDDLHWCTSDTGWSKAGTSLIFGPWSRGTAVLMYHGPFDSQQRLRFIEQHRPTTFCAAPTELRLIVQEDLGRYDLRSLRHCVAAGEPLNPEVIERWKQATGLAIYDGYGLTEALMVCHNYRCQPIRPGSMGKPLPGYCLAVLDDVGHELAPGVEGDLAIRRDTPGLLREFWGQPDATQAAFRGAWFITGDRAWRDDDGYFWFVGRGDDVILSAGYRIGPFEVENALLAHPAVVEAAAVGSPDAIRGEMVKAFVVLRPGIEPSETLRQELQLHTKRITAPYKYPRLIEFVPELPKTTSGKIRRKELKAREAHAAAARREA